MGRSFVGIDELVPGPGRLPEALGLIGDAAVRSAQQNDYRDEMLAFCHRHPDALYRSSVTGHLTGSALVLKHDLSSLLLIHHRKLDRWLQPGGHADGEGNLARVALTEATEETGIEGLLVLPEIVDFDIHTIGARGEVAEHDHLDCRFVCLAPPNAEINADEIETKGARWVPLDSPLVGDGELRRLAMAGLKAARDSLG